MEVLTLDSEPVTEEKPYQRGYRESDGSWVVPSGPMDYAQIVSRPEVLDKPTLVIGDTHGHYDRLEALLEQEGIIDRCDTCTGWGQIATPSEWLGPLADPEAEHWDHECPDCAGDGMRRINFDVEVVHVGDLGHFGVDGTITGDEFCYRYADRLFDVVLWGNHDRAVIDAHHEFGGFMRPGAEIKHIMLSLYANGKLKVAHSAHGFLITHAGLHSAWKQQKGIEFDRDDSEAIADWLNDTDWWPEHENHDDKTAIDSDRSAHAVRDAIGRRRGGGSPFGGILWRDEDEKLYTGFPQVYGHSSQRDGRFVVHHPHPHAKGNGDAQLDAMLHSKRKVDDGTYPNGVGFNIDIGGKHERRLGGIWLPERRLVRCDLT